MKILKDKSPKWKLSQEDITHVLWVLLMALGATLASWITTALIPAIDQSTPVGFAVVGLLAVSAKFVKRLITDYSEKY